MKKTRKILAMAACAILLVCISVGATVAYLTSTDTVTNTFTVGKVAITLDEAKTNDNGDGTVVADAARVKKNSYKLMPGHEYTKDPTIHVATGSENCYLFVKVENGIADLEAEGKTIADQMAAKNWVALEGVDNVYYLTEKVDGTTKAKINNSGDVVVFEKFTLKDDADTTNARACSH